MQKSSRDFYGKIYLEPRSTWLWAPGFTAPATGLSPGVPRFKSQVFLPTTQRAVFLAFHRLLSASLHPVWWVLLSINSYKCRSWGTERLSIWCEVTQQSPESNPGNLALEETRLPATYCFTCSMGIPRVTALPPAQEDGNDARTHVVESLVVSKHLGNRDYCRWPC